MENGTNTNNNQILAIASFKKKSWPWLFVLLAALTFIVPFIIVYIEFFGSYCLCSRCLNIWDYFYFHQTELFVGTLITTGALLLIAILGAIIFVRKQALVITNSTIIYKKGRKLIQIPLSTIQNIDTGAKSLLVNVPFKKFRFKKLQNKKELYDVLYTQLASTATTAVYTNVSYYQENN
ncbi:MAG: hypothetical protein J6Q70_07220 [Clostridia bacterium]|nr:hypothetical protein [Clostridia bacterium]